MPDADPTGIANLDLIKDFWEQEGMFYTVGDQVWGLTTEIFWQKNYFIKKKTNKAPPTKAKTNINLQ